MGRRGVSPPTTAAMTLRGACTHSGQRGSLSGQQRCHSKNICKVWEAAPPAGALAAPHPLGYASVGLGARQGCRCVWEGLDGEELPPERINHRTWRAGAPSPPQHPVTLSNRLPGEIVVHIRLVNGSWLAALLLPVPQELLGHSSQHFTGRRAPGDGRMPEGR